MTISVHITYEGDPPSPETQAIIDKFNSGVTSEELRPLFVDLEKRIMSEDKVDTVKGGGDAGPMNMYFITRYERSHAPQKYGELTFSCNVWF